MGNKVTLAKLGSDPFNYSKSNVGQIELENIISRDLSRLIESKIEGLSDLRKRTNLRCADKILQESARELAQSVAN